MKRLITDRILLLLCVLPLWVAGSAARPGEMTEEEADLIRLDENMVYGEAFVREVPADEAAAINLRDAALASLTESANEIRDAHRLAPLTSGRIHPFVKYFTYETSGRVCGFAYVSLQKIMSVSADSPSAPPSSAPVFPSPEPTTPAPAPVSPSSDAPSQTATPPSPVQSHASSSLLSGKEMDVVLEIVSRKGLMLDELGRLLTEKKRDGSISSFGQVRPGNPIPTDCYLVVIDRSFTVRTLLAPDGCELPVDFPVGDLPSSSSASEFHDCGFVWFK